MSELIAAADFMLAGAAARHAGFAAHRNTAPVEQITLPSGGQAWLVTGYAEVRALLSDTRLVGRTGVVGDRRALPTELHLSMNSHMLNCEPPDHTRLRRLISAAFTGRRIQRLRPRVQEITDELLDGLAGDEPVDLIKAFALPLPIRVLCELIGIPDEEAGMFHGWTETLTASALGLGDLEIAVRQMLDYTKDLLDRKRRAPSDDLLSALVGAHDQDDRLTDDELTSMVFLLLIAGHETTVNLIGNAVVVLLANPDVLAALRARGELISDVVEELLRYESPVQVAMRQAREPIDIAGATIPANAVVMLSLLSANRDPGRFAEPDRFRADRQDNAQLAFGHGIHHCLGAPLARMEGAIAVGALFARFPGLSLATSADNLNWRRSIVMHGLAELPVTLY